VKPALRLVALLATLIVAVLIALASLAFHSEFSPAEREEIESPCADDAQPLSPGRDFRVVSWNLQYSAGRKHRFFYDGGEAVHVPATDSSEAVAGIVAALSRLNPEIALLQEVDRGSTRTQQLDQLPAFAAALSARCQASTSYHRSPFVPHPSSKPLGRVDMHLSLLTRPPLLGAVRHALPLLRESRLRQLFNLKRALLVAELPIDGSELPLVIAVTHLSAFSEGDGTLEDQLGILKRWMDERPASQPWLLGGDFNALPPGDDLERLGEETASYRAAQPAMQALLKSHKNAFPAALEPSARTWLPYGTSQPDRKIDWLFYGGPLELLEARVAGEFQELSDHLPLVARFRLAEQRNTNTGSEEPI